MGENEAKRFVRLMESMQPGETVYLDDMRTEREKHMETALRAIAQNPRLYGDKAADRAVMGLQSAEGLSGGRN